MATVRKLVGLVGLAAAAAVLGLSLTLVARPAAAASSTSDIVAHGGRGGFCGEAGLAAAADALGMTVDELQAQLWGGESLSDLAEAAGVDLQTVQAAVTAACEQATRDSIEQAVTDGDITRAHADWLLEGLDQGFWTVGGRGGFGFGGRHGGPPGLDGGPRFPNSDATATPGSDA